MTVAERLTAYDRRHLAGWLVQLLESDDVDDVRSAALHCSTRYYRELAAERLEELCGSTPRCPICGGLKPGDITHTRCA